MDMASGCRQWMVDIPFTSFRSIPTHLVSVLFGSLIPTYCSIFVICFHSFYLRTSNHCNATSEVVS